MHMSDHIKEQIKGKMQERARLEANILDCTTRLEVAGAGLHSKLVDEEVSEQSYHVKSFACCSLYTKAVTFAGIPSCRY